MIPDFWMVAQVKINAGLLYVQIYIYVNKYKKGKGLHMEWVM